MTTHLHLAEESAESSHLAALISDRFASRLFARDADLWGADAAAEAAVRLGWTDVSGLDALIDEVDALRRAFAERGIDRIVLCGMGGSSLAPAVISRWAGTSLDIIDSTHPEVMRRALSGDLARTAVVVSSKSGGTIETLSHRAAFTAAFEAAGHDPADRIVIVTDPGSPLEADARAAGLRVFLADPDVGGRFSALTAFGLVPSGLAGADVRALVAEAVAARTELAADRDANPALRLAAWLADGLPHRFVLGVLEGADAQWEFGAWVEQLVAESTGKDGRGVLPIALPDDAPEVDRTPGNTRLVRIRAAGTPATDARISEIVAPLGAQILLWEVATAALGRLMGIDPFNQPDVESAKVAARAQLGRSGQSAPSSAPMPGFAGVSVLGDDAVATPLRSPDDLVVHLRGMVDPDGYLAIQAYLDPAGADAPALAALRDALAERLRVPVALGWGPRYLHSTGQLHKGGPPVGAFLQIRDTLDTPLAIPGAENGFDVLIAAQARGDQDVLSSRGRPVLALECTRPGDAARRLAAALSDRSSDAAATA